LRSPEDGARGWKTKELAFRQYQIGRSWVNLQKKKKLLDYFRISAIVEI
jgi:hypothetical protein